MSLHLTAENIFVRAFGNRTLLLTRTGDADGKASAFRLSLDLSQGMIIVNSLR